MKWPLALSTGLFIKSPLISVLERIKEAGFDSIEIGTSIGHFDYQSLEAISQVRNKLANLDLKVYSVHAPYKSDADLTRLEEEKRQKAVKEIIASADSLSLMGGRVLVVHAGSDEEYVRKEEVSKRLEQARKSLLEIHSHCRRLGICLALEDMLAHLLGGKAEQLQWLLSQLPVEDTGICLDTGHSFLTGKLLERVHLFGPRLIMAHIHDNNGVYDDHLPPGNGKLPWPELLQTLEKIGFAGPLVLEIMSHGDVATLLKGAVKGAEFLRDLRP